MNRQAIDELVAYTDYSWARHGRVMEQLSDEQFVRPVPGSGWPAPREAFDHIVGAYPDWLVTWGIAGPEGTPSVESSQLATWADMQRYRAGTRADLRRALEVNDEELFAECQNPSDFGPRAMSVANIVTHLLMHERGHHGDISTLFYQMGVKGYIVDWIAFAALPDQFMPDLVEEGGE